MCDHTNADFCLTCTLNELADERMEGDFREYELWDFIQDHEPHWNMAALIDICRNGTEAALVSGAALVLAFKAEGEHEAWEATRIAEDHPDLYVCEDARWAAWYIDGNEKGRHADDLLDWIIGLWRVYEPFIPPPKPVQMRLF